MPTLPNAPKNIKAGVSDLAYQVWVLATKPADLSSVSGTRMGEGLDQLLKLSSALHVYTLARIYTKKS